MEKLSWANGGLIFLIGVSACSPNPVRRESVQPVIVDSPDEEAIAPTPTPAPSITPEEAYQRAQDVAFSATSIAQSAQTSEDWVLVSSRWQEAINLLKTIPKSNQLYASASTKISQYKTSLNLSRQKAKLPPPPPKIPTSVASSPGASPDEKSTPTPSTPSPTSTNPSVISVPIKRRVGQTPVIAVTFNGDRTFEMIVDTGASSTVITQKMATALGVVATGEATADTASSKGVRFPMGKVNSIAVKGIELNEMQVAIAGRDLDIGLLGQDFFGNYDVTIKQDVIEFQRRS